MRVDIVVVDHIMSACVESVTAFQFRITLYQSGECNEAVKPVGIVQELCAKPLPDSNITARIRKNNAFFITFYFGEKNVLLKIRQ
jgi:hypothetical protein